MPTAVPLSRRIGARSLVAPSPRLMVNRLPTTIWPPALAKLRRLAAYMTCAAARPGSSTSVARARRRRVARRVMALFYQCSCRARDVFLARLRIGLHQLEALLLALDAGESPGTRHGGAERLDDGALELRRLRRLQADHRVARLAVAQRDLHPVRGVRIDHLPVLALHEADRLQAIVMGAAPGDEARVVLHLLPRAVGGQVEAALLVDLRPQPRHLVAVAVDHVPDEALEIRRLRDVHRGARGRLCLGRWARAVAPGAEELVEDVVLVGGEHQAADPQPHPLGDVAGEDVAEVPRGDREGDLLVVRAGRGEIALVVVHDLRDDPRPVDRVHRADVVALLEVEV